MALNQIFNQLFSFSKLLKGKNSGLNMLNFKYIGYLFLSIILLLFLFVSNQLDKKSKRESQNLNSVVKTQEFINLSSYFLSKINSPYKEIKYLIKNNDTVERILKKFQVNSKDLKKIIVELKKKQSHKYIRW